MNERLPALTPQKVIRALLRAGFFIHHISGSHHILKRPDKSKVRVTIAYHTKDLKRSTLRNCLKSLFRSEISEMRAKMMKDEETYTEYTATIPESCAAAFLKLQPNMDFLDSF